MKRRSIVIVAVTAAVVVVAVVAAVTVSVIRGNGPAISASSSARGSDLGRLLSSEAPDGAAWTSESESVGAWVEIEWSQRRTLGAVTLISPTGGAAGVAESIVRFNDGSSYLLASDAEGVASAVFPARDVSSVRIEVASVPAGADAAALTRVSFDGDQDLVEGSQETPSVSSEEASAGALVDGDAAAGQTGGQWTADADDSAPWVQLDFGGTKSVSAVTITGPQESPVDPAYEAAAPLHGSLVFSDGSRVVVSGIAAGSGSPTVVAFTPRMSTSVRLELERTVPGATMGLQEFRVSNGARPATGPGAEVSAVEPPGATCDTTQAVGKADDQASLALVCPAVGASVGDDASIVVSGPVGQTLQITGRADFSDQAGSGAPIALGTSTVGPDGTASMDLDLSALPNGPVALRVSPADVVETNVSPLYVQLVRTAGDPAPSAGYAPTGMTLQWQDDFDGPLSVSRSGQDALYAATKPAYWGASEFGAAVFSDPAWDNGSLAVTDGGLLRIRAQPLDRADPFGWDRTHMSGMLSSLRVGASGFAAQYGYYEARILGAPGKGTWPAFWMLNSESATNRDDTSGEVDAVELYGHNTVGSCHALHNWVDGDDRSDIDCIADNRMGDWAMQWHTYGVEIVPDGANYYIDGSLVAEKRGLSHSDEPFYFMLNLALDGGWPVELGSTGNTSDMYVDWVRAYT